MIASVHLVTLVTLLAVAVSFSSVSSSEVAIIFFFFLFKSTIKSPMFISLNYNDDNDDILKNQIILM